MNWDNQRLCVSCDKPMIKWSTSHNDIVYDCYNSNGNCPNQIICNINLDVKGYLFSIKDYFLRCEIGYKRTTFHGKFGMICEIDYVPISINEDIKTKVKTIINRLSNIKAFA